MGHTQMPLWQLAPVAHVVPHPPQLFGSVLESTHWPPQVADATADATADVEAGACGAGQTLVGAPLCGAGATCCVGPRFQVVDPGTSATGTGLVLDTTTGLTWMRTGCSDGGYWATEKASCVTAGMRLPTKAEAQALAAGTTTTQATCDDQRCAFGQCNFEYQWDTWTSDEATPGTSAWRVSTTGRHTRPWRHPGSPAAASA